MAFSVEDIGLGVYEFNPALASLSPAMVVQNSKAVRRCRTSTAIGYPKVSLCVFFGGAVLSNELRQDQLNEACVVFVLCKALIDPIQRFFVKSVKQSMLARMGNNTHMESCKGGLQCLVSKALLGHSQPSTPRRTSAARKGEPPNQSLNCVGSICNLKRPKLKLCAAVALPFCSDQNDRRD